MRVSSGHIQAAAVQAAPVVMKRAATVAKACRLTAEAEEVILHAELELAELTRANIELDVVGHYVRLDVFRLTVNAEPSD